VTHLFLFFQKHQEYDKQLIQQMLKMFHTFLKTSIRHFHIVFLHLFGELLFSAGNSLLCPVLWLWSSTLLGSLLYIPTERGQVA
jgi:hypothetical protein